MPTLILHPSRYRPSPRSRPSADSIAQSLRSNLAFVGEKRHAGVQLIEGDFELNRNKLSAGDGASKILSKLQKDIAVSPRKAVKNNRTKKIFAFRFIVFNIQPYG